jgi:hypothetical protein
MQVTEHDGVNAAVAGRASLVRRVLRRCTTLAVVGSVAVGSYGAVGAAADGAVTSAGREEYVLTDVSCDAAGKGVLDVTLVNDNPAGPAAFQVVAAPLLPTQVIEVGPGARRNLRLSDLSDGEVVIPVNVGPVAQEVRATIACEPGAEAHMGARVVTADRVPDDGSSATSGRGASARSATNDWTFIIGGVLVCAGTLSAHLVRRRYTSAAR